MTPTAPPTPRPPPTWRRSPVPTTPVPSRPGSITDITSANVLNNLAPDLALGHPDRRRADAELHRQRQRPPRRRVGHRCRSGRRRQDRRQPVITLDSRQPDHRGRHPHRPRARRPPRPRATTGLLADLLDRPRARRARSRLDAARSTDAVRRPSTRCADRPALDPGREETSTRRHHRQRPGLAPAGRGPAAERRSGGLRAARRRRSTRSSAPSAPTSTARSSPLDLGPVGASVVAPAGGITCGEPTTRCASSTSTPRPSRSPLVAPSSTTSPSRTVARAWSRT